MLGLKFLQWERFTAMILTITMVMLLSSGCLPTKGEKPMAVVMDAYSHELAKFIPEKPFTWHYSGTADYVQVMSVTDVFETDATKVCKVKGEIQDLSAGESNMDFKIALTYSISGDAISQEKKGQAMLDSDFDSLIILKAPVKKGTTWEQPVVYPDGQKSTLKAAITAIEVDGTSRVVTVDYADTVKHYFEKRKIREGTGVISFEKSLKYNNESTIVGYKLDSSEVVESASAPTAEAPVVAGKVPNATNSTDEAITAAIKEAVMAFDQGWIAFVNNSDSKIYATLVKDGQAYKLVKNFKRDGSVQKFEEIRMDGVEILGNKAQARVFERIRQTKSNESRVLTYHWIYHLIKVKENWYIDYYEPDTAARAQQ